MQNSRLGPNASIGRGYSQPGRPDNRGPSVGRGYSQPDNRMSKMPAQRISPPQISQPGAPDSRRFDYNNQMQRSAMNGMMQPSDKMPSHSIMPVLRPPVNQPVPGFASQMPGIHQPGNMDMGSLGGALSKYLGGGSQLSHPFFRR